MKNENLNIAIFDDHSIVAYLISSNIDLFFSNYNSFVFKDSKKFFDFSEANPVSFLILDVFLGNENGLQVLQKCRLKYSKEDLKIIILSSSCETKIITDAVNFGANAYITKEDELHEIISAIQHLQDNPLKFYFSKNAADCLLQEKVEKPEIKKLSHREEQLLDLICKAKTAKEIAFELELSVNTIQYYTKRLMTKMGVNRTLDLVLKAIEKGYFIK